MSTYPGQPDPNNAGGQPPYGGGQPSYPGQPGYGASYGGMSPNPTEKNWMGITALVLGVLSLCCGIFTGIPAVIFGVLGIQAESNGQANNKALSITGIVLAVVAVVLNIIAFSSGAYDQVLNS